MKAPSTSASAGGKGVVKQAKVVFETKEGSKIAEADGAGRSRGYGFIEYHTHRSALMGLRWLNGREVDLKSLPSAAKGRDASAAGPQAADCRVCARECERRQATGRQGHQGADSTRGRCSRGRS